MEQRKEDSRILNIEKLVAEIHHRQNEITLPKLGNIEKILFGNGKIGLMSEHIKCQEKIENFNKIFSWIRGLIITIVIALVTFAFGYGQLYYKVESITKELDKISK